MACEARNDISLKWRNYGPKRNILIVRGTLIFGFYFVISYQRINIYRFETMDMVRFRSNNGVSGK